MYKKLNYFKQERNILSIVIEIEDQYLVSSAKFVYFIQKQLEEINHVVISRAKFDDMLTSDNLLVLCCASETENYVDYFLLKCQGPFLTFSSKLKLLENYSKFVESKEMIVWIGLCE